MKAEESKIIIEKIKENPAVDFAEIKLIQAELESIKSNANSANEMDSLIKLIKVYQKLVKAAPGLKSMLGPNVQAMNILLEQLNKKND